MVGYFIVFRVFCLNELLTGSPLMSEYFLAGMKEGGAPIVPSEIRKQNKPPNY